MLIAIEKAVSLTINCVGKIFVVTGIRVPPVGFDAIDE